MYRDLRVFDTFNVIIPINFMLSACIASLGPRFNVNQI